MNRPMTRAAFASFVAVVVLSACSTPTQTETLPERTSEPVRPAAPVSRETRPSGFRRIHDEFGRADGKTVLVVAHRGVHQSAPENSLVAIRNAIALGVDIVEVDVQRTRDGRLVLMHDATVNRTTNGVGVVSQMTLAQVRELRLKMPDGTLTPERVPTLEETMRLARGKCMVTLDKSFRYLNGAMTVLISTGTVDHAIFPVQADLHFVKGTLEKYSAKIHCLPKVHTVHRAKLWLEHLKPSVIDVTFPIDSLPVIHAQNVRMIRRAGARVWVNTMFDAECAGLTDRKARKNPDAAWGRLIDRGVNIIQTDEPRRLLEYLRKRKLHW